MLGEYGLYLSKYLTVLYIQCGYAGQKDDSCNGLDGVGQQDFIMLLKTAQFKICELFISKIFHLILDCS